MRAFLIACLSTTARSRKPFDQAVLIKSCRSTSSIMVRVIRMVLADMAVPRIRLGIRNTPRLPSGSSAKEITSIGGDQLHQMAG